MSLAGVVNIRLVEAKGVCGIPRLYRDGLQFPQDWGLRAGPGKPSHLRSGSEKTHRYRREIVDANNLA